MNPIAMWAPSVLVVLSILALLLKPLLFVRKEAKEESKEAKTEAREQAKEHAAEIASQASDRARMDATMTELRMVILSSVADIKGEIRADQKLVMHRLGELERSIQELRASDADRTSKVIAVDGFAHRIAELERLASESTQRLVKVETRLEK
jgi:TATA-binding protein-associated factor Taf7